MTPVMQRNQHDPDNGVYGDCHRAALASLLDLTLDEVPHFMDGLGPDDGEAFNLAPEKFLRSRGLTPIIFAMTPGEELQEILNACQAWNPGVLYLLGGESASNCGHTVIAGGGRIVHDPSPNKVGIIGPMKDGLYWITYLGSIVGVE